MLGLPAGFWVLAVIAVVADLRPLAGWERQRPATGVFLSSYFTFTILVVWGLLPALAVQAAANLVGGARLKLPPAEFALLVLRHAIALGAASLVLGPGGAETLRHGEELHISNLDNKVAAVVIWLVANYGVVILAQRLADPRRPWRAMFRGGLGLNILAKTALLFLTPVVVADLQGATYSLLLLPVLAMSEMIAVVDRQRESLRRDPLTGALNGRGLEDVIASLSDRPGAPADSAAFALLLVMIDRAHDVNESFGRQTGDSLLIEAYRRIRQVPGVDRVSRLEGGAFAVPVAVSAGSRSADALASDIVAALEAPVNVSGLPFDVAGTVGVVMAQGRREDFATLIQHAQEAVQQAHRRGTSVGVYAPAPVTDFASRLQVLADLQSTLENRAEGGTIAYLYQPQVDLKTGELVGAEALLRWHHPERGLVNTEQVIRIAEPTPLMGRITERTVDAATAQLSQWNLNGARLSVAANVSMRDLHEESVVEHILAKLAEAEVDARQFTIEITEGELISDPDNVRRALARLTDAGVGISVDDFGSGFSSLQHLRQLPITELKIDRHLVQNVGTRTDDRALVRSVIQLAQALGLRVVAEGVEDEATQHMLIELGCHVGQGWLYGRPMPAEDITRMLGRRLGPDRSP